MHKWIRGVISVKETELTQNYHKSCSINTTLLESVFIAVHVCCPLMISLSNIFVYKKHWSIQKYTNISFRWASWILSGSNITVTNRLWEWSFIKLLVTIYLGHWNFVSPLMAWQNQRGQKFRNTITQWVGHWAGEGHRIFQDNQRWEQFPGSGGIHLAFLPPPTSWI